MTDLTELFANVIIVLIPCLWPPMRWWVGSPLPPLLRVRRAAYTKIYVYANANEAKRDFDRRAEFMLQVRNSANQNV